MKKKKRMIVILILIVGLWSLCRWQFHSAPFIKWYVKQNVKSLENEVEHLKATAMPGYGERLHGHKAVWRASKEMVDYEVYYRSPTITEGDWRGYRYYEKDELRFEMIYPGTDKEYEIKEKGDGFICVEVNGDDWEYVEKITDHWYYYERHC